ncbi:MAG TPA: MFS transporter [Spirochaetia bacterium]|nr:MFS transporter [Spirochaetia bacterium]
MAVKDALTLNLQDKGLLATLFFAEFTRGAFFLTFLPIYAVYHLHLTVAAVGLATSIHYGTQTVYNTMAGWQVDRARRPTVLSGLGLGLISLVIMRFHPVSLVLIVASAVFGLAMAPVWLAVISQVAPIEHDERTTRISTVFMVWLGGAGLGPVVINFVLGINDKLAFWFLILTFSIALLLATGSTAPVPPKNLPASAFLRDLKQLFREMSVTRLILPGMFLQTMTAAMLLPVLPVYMEIMGLTHSQYGLLLMAGGVTAVAFFVPMSRVAERYPLKYLLFVGFGLISAAFLLFTRVKDMLPLYVMAALVGFCYAIVLPAWNSLLAKAIPPERQATGWGVFSTVEGAGAAIGPVLGGVLAKDLGYHAPFAFGTVIFLVMALFYLLYPANKLLR